MEQIPFLRGIPSLLLGVPFIWICAVFEVGADTLSDAVDELAAELIENGETAALGIAVDQGGKTLLDKGYGYADRDKQIKADNDTIYRIGSVTKQFTAVAIVQLEAAGKLKFDDTIAAVLPEYPAPPIPITIKNLLQHTSGIPDFTRQPTHRPNAHKDMTHAEMVARFGNGRLSFRPGAKWGYSNSGYYLLGMIIEWVSGETYGDYLHAHVLAPAGLEGIRYELPDGSGRAQGYRREGDQIVLADPISMTQPFAAGALVSTAGDLVKWQRALVEGRLNPPDAFERITSEAVPADGESYGYGVRVSRRDGRRIIHHGGGIEGFGSYLAYYPETDHTIVILANTEGINMRELLGNIEEALFKIAPQS